MNIKKKIIKQIAAAAALILLTACGNESVVTSKPAPELTKQDVSTFFAAVEVEESNTVKLESDGDLWPSAWSDDDYLYTACGDGKGLRLADSFSDIVVGRIKGTPAENNLAGWNLAKGGDVARVWNTENNAYNRKPTGMVSVDGVLYLAVQDLYKNKPGIFDDALSSSIYKSTDKGVTWQGTETPMFDNHIFTTVFFLDYGKDSEHCPDDYVYAYGLDYNWRDSFTNTTFDPKDLYLGRVHKSAVTDISKWEFFAGMDGENPTWTKNTDEREPVLTDSRRIYYALTEAQEGPRDMSVISQGSVVYNKPLDRYIYSSWTEYTFEFYESPTPYGPWKLFYQKDFGGYSWSARKYGGYATTMPSKFISDDGLEMYVISSTFMGGVNDYGFSCRKISLRPYTPSSPENGFSKNNLADKKYEPVYFNKTNHFGMPFILNDANTENSEDSWNGEAKQEDFWGYTYTRCYNFNTVEYTTGEMFENGGWFNEMRVQVRRGFEWFDVKNLKISPDYPFSEKAGDKKKYTLRFDEDYGDGIRIIGKPGGIQRFTSVCELSVYFRKK